MSRYKGVVSYCGAAYAGWQRQNDKDSIQETIEQAIKIITLKETPITGSGRTDAGVNALGQVFHFDSDIEMTGYKWKGAINGFLPNDIHIESVEKVDDNFHARFAVKLKQYDYLVNMGEYDVFTRDTVYQFGHPLDIEKMKEASKYLIGTHDFTSFCSNSKDLMEDQVRTVYDIQFFKEGNILRISYTGHGFLRYMVRLMSGQLIEVGRGKIEPIEVKKALEAKSKRVVRKNAPSCGLTLVRVEHFNILAINEEYYVRDLIPTDILEDNLTYIVSNKKTDEIIGKIYIVQKETSTTIKLILENNENDVQLLLPSLKKQLNHLYSNVNFVVRSSVNE